MSKTYYAFKINKKTDEIVKLYKFNNKIKADLLISLWREINYLDFKYIEVELEKTGHFNFISFSTGYEKINNFYDEVYNLLIKEKENDKI
jgi:hypothetical protein